MNKFDVIVCDPPWMFSDKLTMSDVARGAASNYNVLTNNDILNLNIKDISNPDGAILALWVPSSLIQDGLDIMKAWGFTHKQTYVWVKIKKEPFKNLLKSTLSSLKENLINMDYTDLSKLIINNFYNFNINNVLGFNMGRLFRQTHEICLIGINNSNIYKKLENKSQRSVSLSESLKHSAKPDDLQNSLEIMFPNSNKIEIFARRNKDGWLCLGNEAPVSKNEDIKTSIQKLENISNRNWDKLIKYLNLSINSNITNLEKFWSKLE